MTIPKDVVIPVRLDGIDGSILQLQLGNLRNYGDLRNYGEIGGLMLNKKGFALVRNLSSSETQSRKSTDVT